VIIGLLVALLVVDQSPPAASKTTTQQGELPTYIGMARREADGTIVLDLRADGPGGMVGHGQVRYPPGDKNYAAVARHVGPIPAGRSVPVRPFPD